MKQLLAFWFFCGVSIVSGGTRMVLPCDQPKSNRGPCDEQHPRWSYDSALKKCVLFQWSGCMGNENRFRTQQHCKKTCEHDYSHTNLRLPPAYLPY